MVILLCVQFDTSYTPLAKTRKFGTNSEINNKFAKTQFFGNSVIHCCRKSSQMTALVYTPLHSAAKKPVRYKEAFTAFKIADTVVESFVQS